MLTEHSRTLSQLTFEMYFAQFRLARTCFVHEKRALELLINELHQAIEAKMSDCEQVTALEDFDF